MRNKNETFYMFKLFLNEVENQFNRKIKCLQSDRGTEYDFSIFIDFYKTHGIIHERTAPYSLEMNGKAERKNITFTKSVAVVLLNSGATSSWWGEILLTVCYVFNRIPKSKTKISPYEIWKNRKPFLRTWGTFGLC